MIDFRSSALSDPGQVRKVNQDSAFAGTDVFILADGMGGHNAGEVASRWAVLLLHEQLVEAGPEDPGGIAAPVVAWANELIHYEASTKRDLAGMGTTVCALLGDRSTRTAKLVNVGDSRGYRFRDGTLEQITEDHSLVETLVREGRLRPEDAIDHPQRNIVTRALGVEADVAVDVFDVDLEVGDRYLLCSDGLTDELNNEAITEILSQSLEVDVANSMLVDMANAAGGHDNITCVLVEVIEAEGDGGDADDEEQGEDQGAVNGFVGSVLEEDGAVAVMPDVDGRESGPQLDGDHQTGDSGTDSADSDDPTPNVGISSPVTANSAIETNKIADGADAEATTGTRRFADSDGRDKFSSGSEPRSFPWRVPAFVLGLLVVLAIALFALLASGDSEHYLRFNGNSVVVMKEDSGLFPGPDEEVEGADLTRGDLEPNQIEAIENGEVRGTLEEVRDALADFDPVDGGADSGG